MSLLQVKIAKTAMATSLKRQRKVMVRTILLRLSKAQLLRMFRKKSQGQTQTNHIKGARGLRLGDGMTSGLQVA